MLYKERMNSAYGKVWSRNAYGNCYPPGAVDDAIDGFMTYKDVDHSTALLPFISCGCPHCNALREQGK